MKNVGNLDRNLRLILGVILIGLPYFMEIAFLAEPLWRWLVPIVGLVLIGTALFRFCLLYRILGIKS